MLQTPNFYLVVYRYMSVIYFNCIGTTLIASGFCKTTRFKLLNDIPFSQPVTNSKKIKFRKFSNTEIQELPKLFETYVGLTFTQ